MSRLPFIVLVAVIVSAIASAQHWEFELIDSTSGWAGLAGGFSRDGRLHACYGDPTWRFRYAYRDSLWRSESLTTATCLRSDFAAAANGQVTLMRHMGGLTFVLHERTDSGWTSSIPPVYPHQSYGRVKLALDTAGAPMIAYDATYSAAEWVRVATRVAQDSWIDATVSVNGSIYATLLGPLSMEVNYRSNHVSVLVGTWLTRSHSSKLDACTRNDSGGWAPSQLIAQRYEVNVTGYYVAPYNDSGATATWLCRDSLYCGSQLLMVGQPGVVTAVPRIDSANVEHVATWGSSGTLYSSRTGNSWQTDVIPTSERLLFCDFVLDASDVACVFFLDSVGVPLLARQVWAEVDAGVRAIPAPDDTVVTGDSVQPSAVIVNYGRTVMSTAVVLEVGDEYADTATVADLTPGDSARVVFGTWTAPTDTGQVAVRCYTTLVGDQWPANDTVVKTVYVITGSGLNGRSAVATQRWAGATIYRGKVLTSRTTETLIDLTGRRVIDLRPGPNDVSRLAPGVYFVRQASGVERQASSVTKVVIAR